MAGTDGRCVFLCERAVEFFDVDVGVRLDAREADAAALRTYPFHARFAFDPLADRRDRGFQIAFDGCDPGCALRESGFKLIGNSKPIFQNFLSHTDKMLDGVEKQQIQKKESKTDIYNIPDPNEPQRPVENSGQPAQ